jgi:hypothetical protein
LPGTLELDAKRAVLKDEAAARVGHFDGVLVALVQRDDPCEASVYGQADDGTRRRTFLLPDCTRQREPAILAHLSSIRDLRTDLVLLRTRFRGSGASAYLLRRLASIQTEVLHYIKHRAMNRG